MSEWEERLAREPIPDRNGSKRKAKPTKSNQAILHSGSFGLRESAERGSVPGGSARGGEGHSSGPPARLRPLFPHACEQWRVFTAAHAIPPRVQERLDHRSSYETPLKLQKANTQHDILAVLSRDHGPQVPRASRCLPCPGKRNAVRRLRLWQRLPHQVARRFILSKAAKARAALCHGFPGTETIWVEWSRLAASQALTLEMTLRFAVSPWPSSRYGTWLVGASCHELGGGRCRKRLVRCGALGSLAASRGFGSELERAGTLSTHTTPTEPDCTAAKVWDVHHFTLELGEVLGLKFHVEFYSS